LNHHIDRLWLHQAFLRTRRDGATGVDGQTAAAFAEDLPGNLQSLLDRAKTGTYRARARSISSASPTTGAGRGRGTGS
jgi:hypothetical protein